MAHATAAYRLNPEMVEFLGARLIRIIARGETIIGHYGRRGHVTGVLRGLELVVAMRDGVHTGFLTVTFDKDFLCFAGYYEPKETANEPRRLCSGTRVMRRRT